MLRANIVSSSTVSKSEQHKTRNFEKLMWDEMKKNKRNEG